MKRTSSNENVRRKQYAADVQKPGPLSKKWFCRELNTGRHKIYKKTGKLSQGWGKRTGCLLKIKELKGLKISDMVEGAKLASGWSIRRKQRKFLEVEDT